jgi:hypothetical protein
MAAVKGGQPGSASYRKGCPFEWELRHVWQQPVAPAADSEPNGDRVLRDQRGDHEVAEAAGQPPARPAEHGQQERGGEHPQVVRDHACKLAERSVQRRVRMGARREDGLELRQKCAEGGEQPHARRRGDQAPDTLLGWHAPRADALPWRARPGGRGFTG